MAARKAGQEGERRKITPPPTRAENSAGGHRRAGLRPNDRAPPKKLPVPASGMLHSNRRDTCCRAARSGREASAGEETDRKRSTERSIQWPIPPGQPLAVGAARRTRLADKSILDGAGYAEGAPKGIDYYFGPKALRNPIAMGMSAMQIQKAGALELRPAIRIHAPTPTIKVRSHRRPRCPYSIQTQTRIDIAFKTRRRPKCSSRAGVGMDRDTSDIDRCRQMPPVARRIWTYAAGLQAKAIRAAMSVSGVRLNRSF